MTRTAARRLTLTLIISLFIYALACFSPISWSPDSRWLAFTVVKEKKQKRPDGPVERVTSCQVWLLDVPNDSPKLLAEGWALSAPAFAPDGKRVIFVECYRPVTPTKENEQEHKFPARLVSVEVESGKRAVLAELPKMTVKLGDEKEEKGNEFQWFAPSVSPDGTSAVCTVPADDDSDLVLVDCTSRQSRLLARAASHPKWSPDGKWVCFVRRIPEWDERAPAYTVEAMRPDGHERVFLGEQYARESGFPQSLSWPNVSWCSDSKRVAYTSCIRPGEDEEGQEAVYVAGIDGKRSEFFRGDKETLLANPAWAPDGAQIAVSTILVAGPRSDRFGTQLIVVDFPDKKVRVLAEAWLDDDRGPRDPRQGMTMPSWSPNGRWIAVRLSDGPPALFSTDGKSKKYLAYDGMSAAYAGMYRAGEARALELHKRFAEARMEAQEVVNIADHWLGICQDEDMKEILAAQKLYALLVLNRFEDVIKLGQEVGGPLADEKVKMAHLALGHYDKVKESERIVKLAEGLEKKARESNDPITAAQLWLRAGDVWYEQLWSKEKAIHALTNAMNMLPGSPEAGRAQARIAEIEERFGTERER